MAFSLLHIVIHFVFLPSFILNILMIITFQQELQHKVSHNLPKSILINDSQFRDGLQTDYYKVSPNTTSLDPQFVYAYMLNTCTCTSSSS